MNLTSILGRIGALLALLNSVSEITEENFSKSGPPPGRAPRQSGSVLLKKISVNSPVVGLPGETA
jgi:hypothetical protein